MNTRLLGLTASLLLVTADSIALDRPDSKWSRIDLSIRIVPEEHRMEAVALVRLPAADQDRTTLTFRLRNDMEVGKSEIVEPQGARSTPELSLVSAEKEPGGYKQWKLTLREALPAKTPATVRIEYSGGKTQGFVFYLGPEGCFAGGPNTIWYPRFDQENNVGALHITTPKGWAAKGSGVLTGQRDGATESTYDFDVKQPSLFSFGAGKFIVRRIPGKVPVSLYLLKSQPFEDRMVNDCREIIEVLEREFGPYPYGEFAVVETPSPQSGKSGFGGASFEGFMFSDSDYLQTGFNLAFFAHEIGHQWWGNMVKTKGDKGRGIMDEGLAQFGSLRCVEEMEGTRAAARYRRDGYPGYADTQCGRGYLRYAAAGLDAPLSALPEGHLGHDLPDMKGFVVYDLLARTIGRDRMRGALKRITRERDFGFITWQEFLAQIERSAGRDLHWFYEQWFDRKGAPSLKLEWSKSDERVEGVVLQEAPLYRLSVPVVVTSISGKRIERMVELTGDKTPFSIAVERPATVELDPEFTVLHYDPELRADAEACSLWTRATGLRHMGKPDEAGKVVQEGLQRLPNPDPYGVEFRLRTMEAILLRAAGKLPEAQAAFEKALSSPVRIASDLPAVYYRLAQIAKGRGEKERLEWAVRAAESTDGALENRTGFGAQARRLLSDR